MNYKWKTDIQDKDFELGIINKEKANFMLSEFKDFLKNTIEFSNQIDHKNLIFISSLLTIVFSFKYEQITSFLPIIIGLIISLSFVLLNVSPVGFLTTGNEPKKLYTKDICKYSYEMIVCSECDLYQERIDENIETNVKI